ncbi:helix-turn-helix transcriptional regulator [Saccharibacillus sacchari]|uniref:Helix-turn-helix transcriptional regulator n=1 Tax=Saccharibacillus sacchari TaxID=456493 RepID=A0ACC6PIB5_9BACL
MEYKTDVAALKKKMIDKDIPTIVALSEASGINRNTLSAVFKGKVQPSAEVMRKLVAVLGIQPEEAGRIFFSHNLRIA